MHHNGAVRLDFFGNNLEAGATPPELGFVAFVLPADITGRVGAFCASSELEADGLQKAGRFDTFHKQYLLTCLYFSTFCDYFSNKICFCLRIFVKTVQKKQAAVCEKSQFLLTKNIENCII
jgi:hypothetical protein